MIVTVASVLAHVQSFADCGCIRVPAVTHPVFLLKQSCNSKPSYQRHKVTMEMHIVLHGKKQNAYIDHC